MRFNIQQYFHLCSSFRYLCRRKNHIISLCSLIRMQNIILLYQLIIMCKVTFTLDSIIFVIILFDEFYSKLYVMRLQHYDHCKSSDEKFAGVELQFCNFVKYFLSRG